MLTSLKSSFTVQSTLDLSWQVKLLQILRENCSWAAMTVRIFQHLSWGAAMSPMCAAILFACSVRVSPNWWRFTHCLDNFYKLSPKRWNVFFFHMLHLIVREENSINMSPETLPTRTCKYILSHQGATFAVLFAVPDQCLWFYNSSRI